jgi:tetrahydromethanopterin S-methyltransferase subunit G
MSSPTLKDVYEVVNRLEDKIDKRLGCLEKEVADRVSSVEMRTESLELWKSNLTGKISIIGALAGSVMGVIFSLITSFISRRI